MNSTILYQNLTLFAQLFRRDLYVRSKNFGQTITNYIVIWPLLYATASLYFQAHSIFTTQETKAGTILFAGNLLLSCLVITFHYTVDILHDLEGPRTIDYLITRANPRLILLERIFFAAFFGLITSIPFFPVVKLILGSYLDTSNLSWLKLFALLPFGSLCCASYNQLAILATRSSSSLGSVWTRYHHPLVTLGGFWIPLHVITSYSPTLGALVRCTPLVYFTEGLRQAIIGGPQFMSTVHCAAMLTMFSVIFIIGSWMVFKRRIDHV